MPIIEGLGKDDCQTLHDFEGEVQDLIDEREEVYYSEYTDATVSREKLDSIEDDLKKARRLQSAISAAKAAGCGVMFEDRETDDRAEIPCDDQDEFYEDVDEMLDSVSETVPDYIDAQDAAYDEIQAEENKKVIFQEGAQEVKDRVEELDDDCEIEETSHREGRAAMQVECLTAPWENPEECRDSYHEKFDVKSSGVTKSGRTIPQGGD